MWSFIHLALHRLMERCFFARSRDANLVGILVTALRVGDPPASVVRDRSSWPRIAPCLRRSANCSRESSAWCS